MLVLLAAAMPTRLPLSVGVVGSVSVLDLLLLAALFPLFVETALTHRLEVGYPRLFGLICLPLIVSVLSMAWSQDLSSTLESSLAYAEGIIAYLFVVRQTQGLTPERVLTYMKWYVYLLLIPAVLLLLHVPGFAPQEAGLSRTAGDYVAYYTRLSHPVLGRSNNLATVLAFFVPPLLWWGARHRDARFTRAGFVALIAVVLTLSRGVVVALVLAAIVYLGQNLNRRRRQTALRRRGGFARALTAVALLAIAFVLFYRLNATTAQFIGDRFTTANIVGRWQLLSQSLAQIAERPTLGYGGGVIPAGPHALHAHDTYVQQLLYFGLPLGVLVCTSLVGIWRFFLRVEGPTAGLARILGMSLLGQLLIFTFESSFEGIVLRVLFYLSLGFAVGLLRAAEGEAAASSQPTPRPAEPARTFPRRLPLGSG
jgi:O-antigen ligase